MAYNYGGNRLESVPSVYLPDNSVLVYRLADPSFTEYLDHYNIKDYIQVAAIQDNRYARWTFMINIDHSDRLKIEISEHSWKAFSEVFVLFTMLGSISNDPTKGLIIDILENYGAVLQFY